MFYRLIKGINDAVKRLSAIIYFTTLRKKPVLKEYPLGTITILENGTLFAKWYSFTDLFSAKSGTPWGLKQYPLQNVAQKQLHITKWYQNGTPKGTVLRTIKRYPWGTVLVVFFF